MIANGWLSSGSVIVNYNTTSQASFFFDFLCPLVAGRLPCVLRECRFAGTHLWLWDGSKLLCVQNRKGGKCHVGNQAGIVLFASGDVCSGCPFACWRVRGKKRRRKRCAAERYVSLRKAGGAEVRPNGDSKRAEG